VLRRADLPGFAAKPQTDDAADDEEKRTFLKCAGIAPPDYVLRDFGTAFTQGTLEIDSAADVVASDAEAVAAANALATDKAANCWKATKHQIEKTPKVTVTKLSTTLAPFTVKGADGGAVYHVVVDFTGPAGKSSADAYVVKFAIGSTELTLAGTRTGGAASLDQLTTLADVLAGRVRKAIALLTSTAGPTD